MKQKGITPDEITFIGLLNACSHSEMVDKARELFDKMQHEYQITPNVQHYTCLIDTLGRAGHLKEAEQLLQSLPESNKNVTIYMSLLGACRKYVHIHKNSDEIVQLAEQLAKTIMQMDPTNSAVYVLLGNIYAGAKLYDKANQIRELQGILYFT
jgi:pentatricopeptide repeat protein